MTYLDASTLWPAVILLNTLWTAGYAAFGRSASPCDGEWVRPARSYRVGSVEIEAMGLSADGLATAAAAWGRCRLACDWLLGTKWPALDGRIWRGSWLADVWGQPRTGFPVWRCMARCRLVGDCDQAGESMGRPAA